MAEPSGTIEWTWENYRDIQLFDGTDLSAHEWQDFVVAIGLEVQDAHTVAEVDALVERHAAGRGFDVRTYPGPSHGDPLANHLRIGVIRKTAPRW